MRSSWIGQWDSGWHVFEVAVCYWGCCLCLSSSRRVRGAERLDACFKEHGIEALVAFLAWHYWVLSAYNCLSNNPGISIEIRKKLHHLRGKNPHHVSTFSLWLCIAKFLLIERLKNQPYVAFLCVTNIKICSPRAFEALGSGPSSGFFKGMEHCAL